MLHANFELLGTLEMSQASGGVCVLLFAAGPTRANRVEM